MYARYSSLITRKSLLNRSFRDRRSLLRQRFSPIYPAPGSLMAHFDFVRSCESEKGKASIEDFMVEAIESRCEGLMIKVLFMGLIVYLWIP